MPPLKDVTTMITASRSRHIRFTFIIQNYAQLNSVYGKEDAETIKGNCGNIIYLISAELAALEEISKMCGEVKSKKDDKTASTPLVTVSDLQRMKQFEAIILRMRKQPYKVMQTPDFKINWGKKYKKAEYPHREKRPVHVFDLKTFVKEQRQKKLMEMLNGQSENGDNGVPNGSMVNAIPPFLPPGMMVGRPMNNESEASLQPRSNIDRSNSTPNVGSSSFEMDQLLKKIDARIAELEEEEKRNQEEIDKEDKEKTSDDNDLLHREVVEEKEDEEFFDDFFD